MIPVSILREIYPDLPDDVIEMLSRIPEAGSSADLKPARTPGSTPPPNEQLVIA